MTDWSRIDKCFEKADCGERVLIAAVGGSITQGADASLPENRYVDRIYEWWCRIFSGTKIELVNAGIGATTSYFAAARVQEDLLQYRPDLVLVDFAVNDDASPIAAETFESLLRRILASESAPAVFVLSNVVYDTGTNVQEIQHRIADHYGIPHWSAKDTLYQEMLSGTARAEDFCTPDYWIHPNDNGHAKIAEGIIRMLEGRLAALRADGKTCMNTGGTLQTGVQESNAARKPLLPSPLIGDAYAYVTQLTIANASVSLNGFYPDPVEKRGHLDFFHGGWLAWHSGDRLEGEALCSCMGVRFRETVCQPCPIARFTVTDAETGEMAAEVILDPNFGETWGDRPALRPLLHHAPRRRYRYRAEIIRHHRDDKIPFHLLSVIVG